MYVNYVAEVLLIRVISTCSSLNFIFISNVLSLFLFTFLLTRVLFSDYVHYLNMNQRNRAIHFEPESKIKIKDQIKK